MSKVAKELVESLNTYASANRSLELHKELKKWTLKVMVATAFGLDNPKLPLIVECFNFLSEQLNNTFYFVPGNKQQCLFI